MKSATETYDVFFSYSHEDSGEVEKLAKRVEEKTTYRVWLDKWVLPPGKYWQPQIAQALGSIECCMVFIGKKTPSGWFNQEIQKALDRRANDDAFRVMAVLLPGSDEKTIGSYLGLRTWVDFRKGLDNDREFHVLVCGIKGVAPGKGPEQTKQREADIVDVVIQKASQIKKIFEEGAIDLMTAQKCWEKLIDNYIMESK